MGIQDYFPRWTGAALLVFGLLAVWHLRRRAMARVPESKRQWVTVAAIAAAAWMLLAQATSVRGVDLRLPPSDIQVWFRMIAMGLTLLATSICLVRLPFEAAANVNTGRRRFLEKAADVAALVPPVAFVRGAWVARGDIQLREIEIRIPGLARDLDGLRLVQITDIHLSPFFSAERLDRAIDIANETRAHIALITGDLISGFNDPLDLCLDRLRRLKGESGVFGCHGNHEYYVRRQRYATERGKSLGIRFLRSEAEILRFGNAALRLTGVDYQAKNEPYLEGMAPPPTDALNVLLSHNPDVFPVAAGLGFDLTIAGHTHGGQVTTEILHQHLNPARYITRFVDGLYQEGGKSIYVSRGLGTVGVPVRLGAPPEVSLIRLTAG